MAEVDELIPEVDASPDITALQSEFYKLSAAVGELSPRLNLLDHSDAQRSIQLEMDRLRSEQEGIKQQVAAYLDGELAEQDADLGRRYVEAIDDLAAYPLEDLDHGCRVIANVNKLRVDLHMELDRCARITGRPRPTYPRHHGVAHPYEICDIDKIRAAAVGFGSPSPYGKGQVSSWGTGA